VKERKIIMDDMDYKNKALWVFLSPHLDDAILSCGGLIWQLGQDGTHVDIWTIFAGDAPLHQLTPFAQSLHARWGSGAASAQARRREDAAACRIVGAGFRHFDYPDCIYRQDKTRWPVVEQREDLFQPGYRAETDLVQDLAECLQKDVPEGAVLVVPYGFGSHLDHQLVRRAAETVAFDKWYYSDYPYAGAGSEELEQWLHLPGPHIETPSSAAALHSWQAAVGAYETQLSTFWQSLEQMHAEIARFHKAGGGTLRQIFNMPY
jgi:LmbE family N-acetylglucosaminyl deacetylase